MNKTTMYWVGGILGVLGVYYLYRQFEANKAASTNAAQSQSPAATEAENYTVPSQYSGQYSPGAVTVNGSQQPSGTILNSGTAQPLPMNT